MIKEKTGTVSIPKSLVVSLSTRERCAQILIAPDTTAGDLLYFASDLARASTSILQAYSLLDKNEVEDWGVQLTDGIIDAVMLHTSLLEGIVEACGDAVGGKRLEDAYG
ncbi:hypothetical protein [Pseudomonas sp. CGJS7]|uniref:hypothetical protein n=1 Tax=Pseudomonas sp. CGJS7 TaxID=3109348 RepID=UPI00300BEFFB